MPKKENSYLNQRDSSAMKTLALHAANPISIHRTAQNLPQGILRTQIQE